MERQHPLVRDAHLQRRRHALVPGLQLVEERQRPLVQQHGVLVHAGAGGVERGQHGRQDACQPHHQDELGSAGGADGPAVVKAAAAGCFFWRLGRC